jgi:hypothetical protein
MAESLSRDFPFSSPDQANINSWDYNMLSLLLILNKSALMLKLITRMSSLAGYWHPEKWKTREDYLESLSPCMN